MRRRLWLCFAALVVAVQVCATAPASAAAPSVSVDTGVLAPLAAVPITVLDGPGNRTDWVGVYLVGSPDSAFKTWMYLGSSSHTVPAQGTTGLSGWLEGPAVGGVYEVRFFANDGFTRLATSNSFTVTSTAPTVSPQVQIVSAGGTVAVDISGGPGNRTDWVGVVPAGVPDTAYLDWKYLNDSKAAPAAGRTSGTVTLTMPATAGNYRVVLFLNDGFTALAENSVLVVTATNVPTLRASSSPTPGTHVTVGPGARVTVFFNGTSGAARDWIGLYPDFGFGGVKPPATAFLDWKYLNDSKTAPTAGRTSGSVTFTMPNTVGTYWVRLMQNDGYVEVGEADSIVVGYATSVTPSVLQVPAGGQVTAYIDASLGNTTDWVGLYLVGAPDTAYLDWEYLNGTKVAPVTGLYASTSTRFTAPTTPGTYQFRLFAADGFTRITSSSTFTVT